jgi:predicted RecB family nuclease
VLTKSRYLAGCQCPRRLWLGCFAPELAAEPRGADEAWLALGTEIGQHAQALFPGGILVDEDAWRQGEAIARTHALLLDPSVPAIFEAAFVHAGVHVRVDVLERLTGGMWGLREVKAGTHVKEVHLHDAAVQCFVLEGNGVRVPSVEIVHVDGGYVRGEGTLDWSRLFARVDVSTEVACVLSSVPSRVDALRRVLTLSDPPAVEPDGHCFSPHACDFWTHCTRAKPRDWTYGVPRRPSLFAAFHAAGIERIADIPEHFVLSQLQARVRDTLRSGREFLGSDLGRALASLDPPVAYLDFETMSPPIPLYPGTRPYQRIPFQWSLHEVDASGALRHGEWLAESRQDPRREFAEGLLEAVGGGGEPVVVYSGYEAGVLEELASTLPDLASGLDALRARLVDLLPIMREHVYHPAFGGSFSLKAVAPALVDGFGYGDLDGIAGGAEASAAFLRLAAGAMVGLEEEARLRSALRAYCERDTLALVEVHRALRARAGLGDVLASPPCHSP